VAARLFVSSHIAHFCRRWKVTELSFFGSVMREDFRPDSEVDVLVTFEANAEANCPLCHTPELRMTGVALIGSGSWRCSVCEQRWRAQRLATVAASAFAARHDVASSRSRLDV
jgi:hypothetical protein